MVAGADLCMLCSPDSGTTRGTALSRSQSALAFTIIEAGWTQGPTFYIAKQRRFNDGPRLSEASPAANASAEAETPLSCKHRGQDTTSVTGATPADRYPLYVSGR